MIRPVYTRFKFPGVLTRETSGLRLVRVTQRAVLDTWHPLASPPGTTPAAAVSAATPPSLPAIAI